MLVSWDRDCRNSGRKHCPGLWLADNRNRLEAYTDLILCEKRIADSRNQHHGYQEWYEHFGADRHLDDM